MFSLTKMQNEVKNIVEQSLKKAHDHDRTGNVGKAYAYYTVVAELCPAKRAEIEKAFTDVLCEWGLQLEVQNRFQDVLLCYERSLDIYPTNTRMLNNFAAHFLRNEDPIKAIVYLKRAIQINPTFLPAERNLQNAYSMAVERWHFPMLNDKHRNNAFERAIRKRIYQGYDTVLDVGTGTGIFSLYAANAGAKQVYACEYSSVMVSVARKVFEYNKAHNIKLIPKLSSDLKIPNDIPEKVKLIVTETFDAGLFGELVVPSMINVHDNILDKDGMGMIIPISATLYVAAVECEFIRYRSAVVFDRIKDICPLNFGDISVLPDEEYYDTENLQNVKINYVTEPQVLLTVNFNNLTELREFSKEGVKGVVHVKCRYDGIIDGLVTWFKLYLDEEIMIDTSEGKSCWQYAVFPAVPLACKQSDILTIRAEMSKEKLKCSYNSSNAPCSKEYKSQYYLPKEVIVFLNDSEYIKSLLSVGEVYKEKKIKSVLDNSPFPITGLTLLKENESMKILYYQTDNVNLRLLIEQIAELNGLTERICIISDYKAALYPIDFIITHNFDMKGELKDGGQNTCQKFFSSLLAPNGILLPQKLYLMGQLVYSEDLPKMVMVKDANVQAMQTDISSNSSSEKNSDEEGDSNNMERTPNRSQYAIAEFINEFKINQIFDLNSSLYLYEALSEVRTLIELYEHDICESIINFGKINVTDNRHVPNALVFWYKIQLTPDYIYDTKKNESFMNHSAIVFEDDLRDVVLQGKDVKLNVYQAKGLVKITVLKF